ncbi:MAG: TlpA family protein disulfide reductase, partial [Duncaniella sp.]|nr:TlpA family protein disulfide reductase [Duncaniella sp.]
WCGPCIRQSAVIKDIYKEYGPKGLEVIGVAVWDKPEDTLKGIKDHDLPWMNVINAQSIPTEIYGIQGIPTIILFGPDGTILSRDKQSDELRSDVAKAMASAK